MLLKKVFIFFAQKTHKFHFPSATNRSFCEGPTKIQFDNWKKQSPKLLEHLGFTIQHLFEQ
jgi:hypothetical protein